MKEWTKPPKESGQKGLHESRDSAGIGHSVVASSAELGRFDRYARSDRDNDAHLFSGSSDRRGLRAAVRAWPLNPVLR